MSEPQVTLIFGDPYRCERALAARHTAILAESGVVVAVFQGHTHENDYTEIDGIHYLSFAALIDHTEPIPPTWAQVTLDPAARTITIEGEGIQDSLILSYPAD